MPEIAKVSQINLLPGIKRDGTVLDGDNCSDGQWVRFQRGRPKKMGGYSQITDTFEGPIRSVMVWSREAMNAVHTFSQSKIRMLLVDNNGAGGTPYDRTPAGFVTNDDYIWSVSTLFNAVGGNTGIIAHPSTSLSNIDDNTESVPYLADASGTAAFTAITGTGPSGNGVSGGVFCVAPYAFYYGSDGYLQWCDANQPTILAGGDADSGRITGAKIVCGLPLRSGSGPAGLLWSMDSVIRMDYGSGSGGIFRFSHLTSQTSILSKNGVIEYDGGYYWPGTDRFLFCDGSQVRELPNQMNLNWFFDNLNYAQRQKVWAMKIPHYGEIWWFYPHGNSVECNRAVIFNTREGFWYDTALSRSAGCPPAIFHYPIMAGSERTSKRKLNVSSVSGAFSVGDAVSGVLSYATGTITAISGNSYTVQPNTDTEFRAAEALTNLTETGSATIDDVADLYGLYVHEKGHDAVEGDQVSAIDSYFTTCDFGYPTGGTNGGALEETNKWTSRGVLGGPNRWTRLVKIEPDFVQSGDMTVTVGGRRAARGEEVVSSPYAFGENTSVVEFREQHREIFLTFRSNTIGGHYEMGRTLLWIEPGDLRG